MLFSYYVLKKYNEYSVLYDYFKSLMKKLGIYPHISKNIFMGFTEISENYCLITFNMTQIVHQF